MVVKIGSALLADGDRAFVDFATEIAAVRARGTEVVVVSSGAIALGLPLLGLRQRPTDLGVLQAAAAAGQGRLISKWADAFSPHDVAVAQILVTHGDLAHRQRYLNARNAMAQLLKRGVVPVVNENDTISVDEIKLGDNDTLAAAICGLTDASLVVLLTGAAGLYTSDPSIDKDAQRISVVDEISDEIMAMAGPPARFGTGGMRTKLTAAQAARAHGATTVIAPGRTHNILRAILDGDDVGTYFAGPKGGIEGARKRWIGTVLRPRGTIVVDDGAVLALQKGRSLLAAGVRRVEGTFAVGDAVDVVGMGNEDRPLARGLVRLDSEDTALVAGKRTDDARALLSDLMPDELIHAADLVLL